MRDPLGISVHTRKRGDYNSASKHCATSCSQTPDFVTQVA